MALSEAVTHESESRYRATVGPHGRVVIPAPLRQKLDIEAGTVLTFTERDGELVVSDRRGAVRRLQEMFRAANPEGVSLVDELIAERREEARREAEWMNE